MSSDLDVNNKYMTVRDLIDLFSQLEDQGFGDFTVTADQSYFLAAKNEEPLISDDEEIVDIGLYTGLYSGG